MSKNVKGPAGERELRDLLHSHLGVRLERNFAQVYGGGCDLVVPHDQLGFAADAMRRLSIECKRYRDAKAGEMVKFWEQAVRQAGEEKIPILAYRGDRRPWQFYVPMNGERGFEYTAAYFIEGFAYLVREGVFPSFC